MKKKNEISPADDAALVAAAAAALAAESEADMTQEGAAREAASPTVTPAFAGGESTGTDVAATGGGSKSDADLLSAFLAAISDTERAALLGALSRLADAERLQAREAERAAEEEALAEMGRAPAFFDIKERRDAIRALCSSVAWLRELPLYERLAAAYYIDRGARFGEPTREDLLRTVLSDEELMRELSLRRREAKARVTETLPPVGRTAGIGSTPATVKKSPRSLDEARDAAKKFLRFYK